MNHLAQFESAPWADIITKTGPFGLVIIVVVWLLKSLVPKLQAMLESQAQSMKEMFAKQADVARDMLAKQEEAGTAILQGMLRDYKEARDAFTLALDVEQKSNTVNTMRLYDAIERGNRLLLFLIAQSHGGVIPAPLKAIFEEPPKKEIKP